MPIKLINYASGDQRLLLPFCQGFGTANTMAGVATLGLNPSLLPFLEIALVINPVTALGREIGQRA